jgi:cytosine/adenosine deaminase-related metal-dependent hydrolase
MDDSRSIIADGAIAVRGCDVVDLGADQTIAARTSARTVIDAQGGPVHPGLVEAHLHASFQLFRSALPDHLAEDDSFDTFESVFYNTVDDDEERISVALASAEMIRNGTTCFLEAGTVLQPATAADAAAAVGIRAVIGDAFIWDCPQGFAQGARAPHDRPTLRRTPQTFDEAVAQLGGQLWRNDDPESLVSAHIALLGLGTASESLLLRAKEAADAAGVTLNLHQSYSPADTGADRDRFGADPLVHLERIGVLADNVTLAHGNHLTDAECEALLRTGAAIAWAPAASMMWGHGACIDGRHAELHRRGVNIALGSDSPNWSNDFDLFKQANLAVLTAREAHRDRGYLTAEDGLWMATRGGAKAAGLADRIGSIEIGKRADLVIHSMRRPEITPPTDMIRNLIYSARSKTVRTVIVNGVVVLDDGKFTTIDEDELIREAAEASAALLSRMGKSVVPNQARR